MQELTLTGATLLSNHDGPGSPAVDPLFLHNHTGPTTSSADDVESTTTTTRLPVGAHHRDGAAHDHDHCGCGTAPARPSVQLQVPVTELVAQEPPQIRKALQTILRMGTYELFAEVLQAWQQTNTDTQQHHYNNTTATLTNQPPVIASTPVSDELVVLNEEGHGLVHWASKRTEDVRFLTLLLEHVANGKDPTLVPNLVTQPTRDATHMTPLHWACTEPHALPVIRRLLNAFTLKTPSYAPERLLEARDSTGCTPLLIAAQYGQVETVAYLIQKGANKAAKDDSHDTATHWAAYKGSPTVLGLLLYYDVRPLTAPDVYGQTPLHLAALRGHASACRYMIHRLPSKDEARRLLTMTDKNGRTAEALAAHKQKDAVVAVLQSCQNRLAPPRQRFRQVLAWKSPSFWMRTLPLACWQCTKTIVSVQAWQSWLGIGSSVADDDSPVLPYYYVLSNYCVNVFFYGAVLLPLGNVEKGLLWDCMTLHIWNVLCSVASFYCLVRTQTTDPGNLNGTGTTQVDIQPLRRLYEVTLEAYAHDDDDGPNHAVAASQVQLCHSCHIARPPRSKHDRFTKTCVLQFDHHCPFVGATIGLYNYKWFYLMLLFMTLYFLGFSIALGMYFVRSLRVPLWQVVLGLYLAAHVFMTAGMWFYHTQLLLGNLTTNEHLNLRKYPYLWETRAYVSGKTKTVYRNPWNISWWHNIQDRFHPSAASYTVPESHETVRQSQALLSTVTSSSSSSSTATPTPLRHVPTQEAV